MALKTHQLLCKEIGSARWILGIWRRLQAFAGDCRVVPVVRPKGLAFRYCRFPVPTPRTVSKEQGCSDCVFATAKL